jgi:hypothetical protein
VTIQAILESASNPKNETDKSNCVDIKVQIDGIEVVIVEIQFRYEYDYFERTLFGVSKAVCEQLKKGEPYSNIKKVYAVSIVYFDMGEDADYVFEGKLDLKGRHTKAPVKLIPSLAEKFGTEDPGEAIYPEYYFVNVAHFGDEVKEALDEWVYYLKHNEVLASFRAKGMQQIAQQLAYDALPPKLQLEYDKEQDRLRGLNVAVESAKMEGRELGIAEGRIEGRAEGRAEGARAEKLVFARKLKDKGMSAWEVADLTELTVSEVEAL